MKFKRLFFDSSINYKAITKGRFVLALIIGLASANVLYSFFYVLDDVYKVLEIGFTDFPTSVSENEKYKSNILYAGISVIIGNSVFISFLFSRPSNAFDTRNPKRSRLLNDQVFLGANFTHWFLRIGVTFGVFSSFGFNFKGAVFYYPLILLILVVLYLDIWKTLLLLIKKNKYKILIFHFLGTVLLVLTLAKFDVTDYKKVEEVALRNNPVIDLPHSLYDSNYNIYNGITIKLKLNSFNKLELFSDEHQRLDINKIHEFLKQRKSWIREEMLPRIPVNIIADSKLKLHFIKELEAKLLINNLYKVNYITTDINRVFNNLEINKISCKISPDVLKIEEEKTGVKFPFPSYLPPLPKETRFSDSLLIKVNKNVELNGLSVSKEDLKQSFKNRINAKTYFRYIYDENTTYQDYIDVLSAHFIAAEELRKEEQIGFKIYPYSYNAKGFGSKAFNKERLRLLNLYPIIIRENYKR
ncbi:hypothetical protein [Olleya sp. YS]|uniref:hypothetical protein n=1 Tax=Olleya sp. YS TaxID=3028318 RepID=UPI002434413F|nr:hypothetical protein [Olleya sp. YS]WGD33751.1 hypothetical protein Ollyesu_08160 [Olleya sp. YS]